MTAVGTVEIDESRGIEKSVRLLDRPRISSILYTMMIILISVALMYIGTKANSKPRRLTQRRNLKMPRSEAKALARRMRRVQTYLEWGSGGSTLNIAPLASRRAVSIENDIRICRKIRKKLTALSVQLICVPTTDIEKHKVSYSAYESYVDRIDMLDEKKWDFIFVNGVARMLCTIKALSYIGPNSILAINNMGLRSNEYDAILNYYDVFDKFETDESNIVFLRRKRIFHSLQENTAAVQGIINTISLLSRDTRPVLVNLKEIWMPKIESKALIRRMQGVQTYLEWGSGGSTLNVAPLATRRAVSIEHDRRWCAKMQSKLKGHSIEYYCIPPNKKYKHDGSYSSLKSYVDRIDTLGEDVWDFVLIDGRARVACAVKALAYISPDSVVTIHDYARTRGIYSAILFFYEIDEKVHVRKHPGIAFLRRKPQFDVFQGNTSAVQAILDTGPEMLKLRDGKKAPAIFNTILPSTVEADS